MAQPTQYTRQYNFNDFQTTSPADPLPGVQVDNELNAAKTNLDGLNANIAKIQRDDGLLANQSVHKNALDVDVLALIGLSGYTVAGNWSASNAYTAGTLVNFNDATYLATVAHTSGTVFATDKDAGNWILLANAAIDTSASAVDKFEGTGSQTVFTLSFTYTSNTDVLVFVNGALRNPGDDYTISSNQITFSTAPSTPSVSGNENVIIWGPSVTAIAAKNAAETASGNASGFATAASNSAAAALTSENNAAASAATATTQAGTATTQAGIATSKAALTAADAVSTAADVVSTNADVVTTNADAATTTADRAQVNTDKGIVAADKGIVAADKAIVAADKALVAADKVDADNARIAAQAAQAAAEAALDTFDDRFLGALTSDPTLDNDGNALLDGAIYWDTTNEVMKVYDQTNTVWRQLSLTGTNQANVNTVAGQISPTNNIATVAARDANIGTVAARDADIGTVAARDADIGTVAASDAAINNVANNLASVNNFGDTYFVSATAPSNPTIGDLWFDSSSNTMKVYGSSGFQNAGSSVNGTSERKDYIVGTSSGAYTGSTTVFPATYDAGFVDVYLNGIKLQPADFTAANGTSVTLGTAAQTNDTVSIVAFGTFQISNFSIGDANNVDLAGLANGQFLQYDSTSGNFEPANVATDLSGDSTPQLGGVLDTNGNNIEFPDSSGAEVNRLKFGAPGDDLHIYHDGSNSYVSDQGTGSLRLNSSQVRIGNAPDNETMATFTAHGAANLFYDNASKLITTSAGVTVSGDIQVDSTSDDATVGPTLNLRRMSGSPAPNDILGQVKFNGKNDAAENITYARIYTSIQDETDGTEDSRLEFKGLTGGAETTYLQMKQGVNTFYRDVELSTSRNLILNGNNFETTVTVTDPTADRTITLPDATGTVLLTDGDGSTLVTATPAELNILDGVTATTAELNKMDGVTATTAELNYTDGVTSNIQTQLNSKGGANTPVVTARKGANQTLTRNVFTKITGFTSSEYDSDSAWNGSRFTVPSGKGGRYFISCYLSCYFGNAGNDGEQAMGIIHINGTAKSYFWRLTMDGSARNMREVNGTGSLIYNLSAGDYVEFYCYMQDDSASGTLILIGDANNGSQIGIMRID